MTRINVWRMTQLTWYPLTYKGEAAEVILRERDLLIRYVKSGDGEVIFGPWPAQAVGNG